MKKLKSRKFKSMTTTCDNALILFLKLNHFKPVSTDYEAIERAHEEFMNSFNTSQDDTEECEISFEEYNPLHN